LHDFNARVGDVFAAAQGGTYAHPRLTELVAFIREQGIAGVGQSSWGPTIFAIVGDKDRADDLVRRVRRRFDLSATEVFPTVADNVGATISMH
jgi:predicted sugar kinase